MLFLSFLINLGWYSFFAVVMGVFVVTRGIDGFLGVQINGLPFNKYSWLVTHNAFSIVDAPLLTGSQRITFYNQEDTVTNQLRVRVLHFSFLFSDLCTLSLFFLCWLLIC